MTKILTRVTMKNWMTNSLMIKILLLLVASGVSTSVIATGTTQQKKPNILLILTDDQGAIDMNCYGSKDLYTPNMDKLASQGIRFTHFYAAASVCSPSRAALLTGKTNLRAGLWGNVPVPAYADIKHKYGMPAEQVTMAELLKDNGYYTALVGKWHLGHKPNRLPNAQGFDYYFGFHGGCIDNYSHFMFWSGPNMHDLYQNEKEVYHPGEFFPDLMVHEVNNIIDIKREKPFFIYWAINNPHYPYQGEPKWLDYYKNVPTPRKEYAAFLSTMDVRIGEVLDHLEESGLANNTVVILQSDHGFSTEERAFWGGGSAGKLRGSKFSYFEGGIRVPAIIKYPGVVPENEVREQLCMEMDWFATVADIAGADIKKLNIDGISLMPVMEDKHAPSQHDVTYWQHGSYDDNIAQWVVRRGDWKLIGNAKERTKEGEIAEDKLFLSNLSMDETERENFAKKFPEKVKELKVLHDAWIKKVRKEMGE